MENFLPMPLTTVICWLATWSFPFSRLEIDQRQGERIQRAEKVPGFRRLAGQQDQ